MKMIPVPKIGDYLRAQIVSPITATEWKVNFPTLPEDGSAKLKSRSANLYQPGDEELFWVYGIVPKYKLFLFSDSEFGRLPISDRMRPRYIQALRSALRLISCPQDVELIPPDHLSEIKGMFNRGIRKDQWDWFTVYDALDCPRILILRKAAHCFGDLARTIRQGEKEKIKAHIEQISNLELESMLRKALSRILASSPRLSDATTFQPIHTSSTDISSPEEEQGSNLYIISHVARAKRERANASHQRTLQILVEFLESNGFVVERSRLVDAYCRLKTGPAIFEVKSITPENEREQCRQALSQLYEYRYIHSVPEASLWIVLSDRPQINWMMEYLQIDRGLKVLWIESDNLKGPGLTDLLKSWSTV